MWILTLLFVILLTAAWRWVSTSSLTSETIRITSASESVKRDVWNLFSSFFEKEFVDFADFDRYLNRCEHHLLLFRRRADHNLQGFIIVKVEKNVQIGGCSVTVVKGDFFALAKEYRANSKPLISLLLFCLFEKMKQPKTPLYYFFITYSYRSYLSFARSMGEYWPRHSCTTPEFEKKLLDKLGKQAADDPNVWGIYNEDSCVIHDQFKGQQGALKLSTSGIAAKDVGDSPPRKLERTLEFFLSENPGHAVGDCFCVCAPICWSNFMSGFKKATLRILRRSGRRAPKDSKDVAFGMGVRKGDLSPEEFRIRNFHIKYDEKEEQELRQKLSSARFPDQVTDDWQSGTNLKFMKELTNYWKESFNWKRQVNSLNKFPHFKTCIDGLDVHFLHVRSQAPNAVPLLLIHGWPSSVFEFYKIIEQLTDPEMFGGRSDQAFHVICPSLPGYGWSEAPKTEGFDVKRIAAMFAVLMTRLGYARYGAHGGDWGGLISSYLALDFPQHCKAIHITLPLVDFEPESLVDKVTLWFDYIFKDLIFSKEELKALEDGEEFSEQKSGYADIQMTRPQTLGYGVADSPVGLAAWIAEKLREWSDCEGEVENRFSKNDVLTLVMIYWTTNTITSSFRLYYETKKSKRWNAPEKKIDVPVACAVFPKEVFRIPRRWAERTYNIRRWTQMERGGHFPAWEEPEMLAKDLRAFFFEDLQAWA
eukprot:TRINITY_DN4695_c0_g1_i2.p1 TRINITY_DN4695_c0_g1~~TRINITY_DN4695_c0_g1_i2.p1  ORF type:complete len:704 (-),score=153.82 TRINITY_DN4695_c0_g1_i2:1103-3214(-)